MTVETLGNVKSEQPICPSNTLIMKSKVVTDIPPGKFVRADEFGRCRRSIQQITNK